MERIADGAGGGGLTGVDARSKWLLAVASAAALAGVWFFSGHERKVSLEELAGRLPHADRLLARFDVAALRRAGLLDKLAGKAGVEEAEYKQFVASTGFDYRTDLDSALVAYSNAETLFFLTGRFDWTRLRDFVAKQGGDCGGGMCRMESSTPGRRISFARINEETLALASSTEADGVRRLASAAQPMQAMPGDPVWVLLPAPALKDKDGLPAGTRAIASAVEDAERVVLGIGSKDNRFEARLEARFHAEQQADAARRQLQTTTELLNKMLTRDKLTPNPRNLTGVLSGGHFRIEGPVLKGTWPVDPAFLE